MRLVSVVAVILLTAAVVAVGCVSSPFGEGLGCSSAVDTHEPNDEPQQATPLIPDETLKAVIAKGGSSGDLDIYSCEVPQTVQGKYFRLEIRSSRARHLEVQVGANVPGAWEAISWPGWRPVRSGDGIVVEGGLKRGTVLVFVSGDRRVEYSLRISFHE